MTKSVLIKNHIFNITSNTILHNLILFERLKHDSSGTYVKQDYTCPKDLTRKPNTDTTNRGGSSIELCMGILYDHAQLDLPIDSTLFTQNKTIPIIEEEGGKKPTQPDFCGATANLPGDMMWQSEVNPSDTLADTKWQREVNAMDVLACADTCEDILPNNQITRYLKAKYDTDSLGSDEEDESTLNTVNTNGNTWRMLNITQYTLDHTLDESLDINALDQPPDCPLGEGIEVKITQDPSLADCIENSSLLQKPDYPELLSDLVVTTRFALNPSRNEKKRRTESDMENLDTSTIRTTTLDSVPNLKFTPWIGEGGEQAQQAQQPPDLPPVPSPSPFCDNDDLFSKTSRSTTDITNDSFSKTSESSSKEAWKLTCSSGTATGRSIEVIGRGIEIESEDEKETMRGARERRWAEMKAILQATAETLNNNTEQDGKKKGYWKKTVKVAIISLHCGKKKPHLASDNKVDDCTIEEET